LRHDLASSIEPISAQMTRSRSGGKRTEPAITGAGLHRRIFTNPNSLRNGVRYEQTIHFNRSVPVQSKYAASARHPERRSRSERKHAVNSTGNSRDPSRPCSNKPDVDACDADEYQSRMVASARGGPLCHQSKRCAGYHDRCECRLFAGQSFSLHGYRALFTASARTFWRDRL
jgi:hypothetical protein